MRETNTYNILNRIYHSQSKCDRDDNQEIDEMIVQRGLRATYEKRSHFTYWCATCDRFLFIIIFVVVGLFFQLLLELFCCCYFGDVSGSDGGGGVCFIFEPIIVSSLYT